MLFRSVSNHLACLRWCGFVTAERRGKRVFYRLSDERVAEVVDMTKALLEDNERSNGHAARRPVASLA